MAARQIITIPTSTTTNPNTIASARAPVITGRAWISMAPLPIPRPISHTFRMAQGQILSDREPFRYPMLLPEDPKGVAVRRGAARGGCEAYGQHQSSLVSPENAHVLLPLPVAAPG